MTAKVNFDKCDGIAACVEVCPSDAIAMVEGKPVVDEAKCCDCAICQDSCPTEAIKVDD